MQSVARQFEMSAVVNEADQYPGKLLPIPQAVDIPLGDGKHMNLYGRDALYSKALTPIQPGASVTGILMFTFESVPVTIFETHKTKFELSFKDAFGNEYNIEIPLGTMPVENLSYYPGINMSIIAPPPSTNAPEHH